MAAAKKTMVATVKIVSFTKGRIEGTCLGSGQRGIRISLAGSVPEGYGQAPLNLTIAIRAEISLADLICLWFGWRAEFLFVIDGIEQESSKSVTAVVAMVL